MLIPSFWAEGRAHSKLDKPRQTVTVRRFGWSDASQAEAQAMADRLAREVHDRIVAGEVLDRNVVATAYNGADGAPIREEILARHGTAVVTRNSYGAHCLNTPDVLFADIDFTPNILQSLLGDFLTRTLDPLFGGVIGTPERDAMERVQAFVAARPDELIRVYRTPNGLRILMMHRTYDPNSADAAAIFDALRVDKVYRRMCERQRCFRARLTPKPWRIGIGRAMRPRPGVWPVKPEKLPKRSAWIAEYERAARHFAACRFVASHGTGVPHPEAEAVQRLHDDASKATSDLPIA